MAVEVLSVSSKGQVVLPMEMRKKLLNEKNMKDLYQIMLRYSNLGNLIFM